MGKPNNQKHIRERREKVLMLLAKGYNQTEIAKELGTTKQTTSNDMKAINEISNQGLFSLAKTLPTMYLSCIETVNQGLRAAWNVHDTTNNDKIKLMAISLIMKGGLEKFLLFERGPAMLHINGLESEVAKLKSEFLEDKEREFKRLPYPNPHTMIEKENKGFTRLPYPSPSRDISSTSTATDLDKP